MGIDVFFQRSMVPFFQIQQDPEMNMIKFPAFFDIAIPSQITEPLISWVALIEDFEDGLLARSPIKGKMEVVIGF